MRCAALLRPCQSCAGWTCLTAAASQGKGWAHWLRVCRGLAGLVFATVLLLSRSVKARSGVADASARATSQKILLSECIFPVVSLIDISFLSHLHFASSRASGKLLAGNGFNSLSRELLLLHCYTRNSPAIILCHLFYFPCYFLSPCLIFFFVLFHSCCFHARMLPLGTTLVHELHTLYIAILNRTCFFFSSENLNILQTEWCFFFKLKSEIKWNITDLFNFWNYIGNYAESAQFEVSLPVVCSGERGQRDQSPAAVARVPQRELRGCGPCCQPRRATVQRASASAALSATASPAAAAHCVHQHPGTHHHHGGGAGTSSTSPRPLLLSICNQELNSPGRTLSHEIIHLLYCPF